MSAITPKTEEEFLQAIITSVLSRGAKAHEDAAFLVGILADDAALLSFFRDAVRTAINEKAGNPVKARKIFRSLNKTARAIFGDDYSKISKEFDRASRAAVQKAENQ